MGDEMVDWTGKVPRGAATWTEVEPHLTTATGRISRVSATANSPYKDRFYNGATIFPRMLFFVEEQARSPLGVAQGKVPVRSQRTVNEKKPWKDLPSLEGVVESEFIRPVILSDCLLPYLITDPAKAVIPWDGTKLMGREGNGIEIHPGLDEWWRQASARWEGNRSTTQMTLDEQLDYMSKLSRQFPLARLRVVYNKSGMHVVAAKLKNPRAVVENGLYWATTSTESEADFLCAILNSPAVTELARPYMSYGKDERDIAKHVWQLPIPEFDASNSAHAELAQLGRAAEVKVRSAIVDANLHFAASRRRLRDVLAGVEELQRIDEIVFEMIS